MNGRRIPSLVLCLATAALWIAAPASAAPELSPITVEAGPHEITDADGTLSVSVPVRNQTQEDLALSLSAAGGCVSKVDQVANASTSATVTFELSSCPESGEFEAELVAKTNGAEVAALPLALKHAASDTDFSPIARGFGIGAVLSAVLVMWFFWRWKTHVPDAAAGVSLSAGGSSAQPSRGWGSQLPGIAEDWSFSDSWAANIGLIAAIVTGVFGSAEPLEALLGDDSATVSSVALVAAALTAALIGAAPIVLYICSSDANVNTVRGVLFAAALVLSATTGLILTLLVTLTPTEVANWAQLAAVVAVGLLTLYAWVSLWRTLTSSLQEPAEVLPTPSISVVVAETDSAKILLQSWRVDEGQPSGNDDPSMSILLGTRKPVRRSAMI